MSSFVRTIQRTVARAKDPDCRASHYMGRGSKLGVKNPKAKDLLARKRREKRTPEPADLQQVGASPRLVEDLSAQHGSLPTGGAPITENGASP